jgi:protein-disulfide isomerase
MKKTWTIIVAILLIFGGLFIWALSEKNSQSANFDQFNTNSVIKGNQYNGNIADHVKGNPKAPVLIFEYADYQCPGCSTTNPRLNKLLQEYGDKLGLVYRHFLLSYHQNGTAAASASEAAGLQGYWKEYADLLFRNQSAWENASASDRTEIFADYFNSISKGKGDIAKFKQDMSSRAVKQKIEFDTGLAKKAQINATPTIIIDGQNVDFSKVANEEEFLNLMRTKINAALKK